MWILVSGVTEMIEIIGGRLLILVNGATVGTSADPLLSGGNAQEALDNNLGKCKDERGTGFPVKNKNGTNT